MEGTRKILLVDDEQPIIEQLIPILERAGFDVISAPNGEEALRQIEIASPDLIVLDVIMPRLDGRGVLRRLRQANNWIPAILLTQVNESVDRIMALEEGADDYLNKPYDPLELIARIRAVLRRIRPGQPPLTAVQRLVSGELSLDRVARKAFLNSTELSLTRQAFALLEYLMTHSHELLSRERLLNSVWVWNYETGTRAVDARICEIRQALTDDSTQPRYIETVIGEGYRFISDVSGT